MNVYYDFVKLIMIIQASFIFVCILLKILEKNGLEWKKGRFRFKAKLDDYVDEITLFDKVGNFLSSAMMFCFVTVVLVVILLCFNDSNSLYTMTYIAALEDSVSNALAYAGIAISIVIFFASLKQEEHYLMMSKKDIMENEKIYKNTSGMLVALIVIVSISVFFASVELGLFLAWSIIFFQIAMIYLWWIGTIIIFKVLKIALKSRKMRTETIYELRRIFSHSRKVPCSDITDEEINTNLASWANKYIRLKFFKFDSYTDKITKIRFRYDISAESKWRKFVAKRLMIGNIVIAYICFAILHIYRDDKVTEIIYIGIEVVILISYIAISYIPYFYRFMQKYLINGFLDISGYEIELEKSKRKSKKRIELYVGNYPVFVTWTGRICKKYLEYIKDVMAFYCVLAENDNVNIGNSDVKTMMRASLEELLDYLNRHVLIEDDLEESTKMAKRERVKLHRVLYYMPVFVCGYYYYNKYAVDDNDSFIKQLKKLYISFKLSNEENEEFHDILNGFVYDAHRCRVDEMDRKAIKEQGEHLDEYCNDYIGRHGYWQLFIK